MRFQANHSLRADDRVVYHPRSQIQAISRLQIHLFTLPRQTKHDRTNDDVDDLMKGMAMSAINIPRGVRPTIGS
jgi:hypothetical protein